MQTYLKRGSVPGTSSCSVSSCTQSMLRAGCATRSYLYVEDVAEAFDVILHRGITGEARPPLLGHVACELVLWAVVSV